MKFLLRTYLFNVFALWITSQILPGLVIEGTWLNIMIAGIVLSILMLIIKPILKILFIPINIITFGLLSWMINVIVIFLLTMVVPEVQIVPFSIQQISAYGFAIPTVSFNYIMALIVVSFSITVFGNILHTVSEG